MALFLYACVHAPTSADTETRSYHYLPTGNGHGFQVFDSASHKLIAFLDHPYRYLRAPKKFCHDGPERRNLIDGFSLGMQFNGQTVWAEDNPGADVSFL